MCRHQQRRSRASQATRDRSRQRPVLFPRSRCRVCRGHDPPDDPKVPQSLQSSPGRKFHTVRYGRPLRFLPVFLPSVLTAAQGLSDSICKARQSVSSAQDKSALLQPESCLRASLAGSSLTTRIQIRTLLRSMASHTPVSTSFSRSQTSSVCTVLC